MDPPRNGTLQTEREREKEKIVESSSKYLHLFQKWEIISEFMDFPPSSPQPLVQRTCRFTNADNKLNELVTDSPSFTARRVHLLSLYPFR